MALFAGIDLGTSTLKVLVVDEKGKTIALAQAPYEVHFEKNFYAEQDPNDWILALETALGQIKDKCDLSKVIAIGFSGQMHGIVAIDRKLNLLRKSIIWMDQRTSIESKEIKEILGDELIRTELLNKPVAGVLLCSLYWLKKHEKESYDSIYKILSPKDYLRFYMTGEICTEQSDASATLAFAIKDKRWSSKVLNRLGLDENKFAEVSKSHESAGKLRKEFAKKFGFSDNVFIALGGGDSAMQLLGNGIIDEGKLAINIGTASQLASALNTPISDEKMRLQLWCHSADKRWYVQGGAMSGGVALKWFKSNVLNDKQLTYSEIDKMAKEVKVGSNGLIFLPYLSGSRTPNLNPKARAVFFGLNMTHTYKEMTRAIMEGVVYNLKQSYDILKNMGINSDVLIASGGGANGSLWRQIQADIFNLPVYTTGSEQEACLGAAIIAAFGSGYFSSIDEACDSMVESKNDLIYPIKENVNYYKEMYEIFVDLYKANSDIFYKIK